MIVAVPIAAIPIPAVSRRRFRAIGCMEVTNKTVPKETALRDRFTRLERSAYKYGLLPPPLMIWPISGPTSCTIRAGMSLA